MEASERRGRLVAVAAILFIIFWSQCKGVEGHRNTTKMLYVCPKQFIRLGHSCYYFSEEVNTWHKAVFKCIDLNSTLTVPARWEDRNLRNYLNKNNFDKQIRWIGGIYDYSSKMWKWGGALKMMRYQSFSKMKKMSPEQLQWHCIAMMPELLYRWAPRQCTEERQYICQTKLRKIPKSEYMKKQREMNAITVPSASREVNRIQNDVTPDPRLSRREPPPPGQLRYWTRYPPSAKSYHYMVKKRSKPSARPQSKLRKLFPGYKWNRHNPEASYRYNAELLRSGKTGLSKQKVNGLIARLKHMRDVQLAKRKRSHGDWLINETRPKLVRTNARTYTMDNNISALHPKTIVEEIDLPPPPPPPVVVPRPARAAW